MTKQKSTFTVWLYIQAESEALAIQAKTYADAVIEFCHDYDHANNKLIASAGLVKVLVRHSETKRVKAFHVTNWTFIYYHPREVTNEET